MRTIQFLLEIEEFDKLADTWQRCRPLLHQILAARHDWTLEAKPLPTELLINETIMRDSTQIQELMKAAQLLAKMHDSQPDLKLFGMKFVLAPESYFRESLRENPTKSGWFSLR